MTKKWGALLFLLLFLHGPDVVSATAPPLKIVAGIISNVLSTLVKWLWSLKSTAKPGKFIIVSEGNPKLTGLQRTEAPGSKVSPLPGRSMMKFESGYTVETVFDGSKHGIEPYSVELSPSGELFVLDAENSNLYKVSTPLSGYSRPKLVAGSPEGHSGHVDGKLREARLNNPRGIAVDDRGNTYIADNLNMAIRKITPSGTVTTIAGGKRGHVDGPSDEAKFSNDFDVGFVPSTCSLLVVDRGNQAIREIKLEDDACGSRYDAAVNGGVIVLFAAGFFGYLLALLQRRLHGLVSPPHQAPTKSLRPPLIPSEEELRQKQEQDGLLSSFFRLLLNFASTGCELFVGLFTGFKRKPRSYHLQQQFTMGEGVEPPAKRSYPVMAKSPEYNPSWGFGGGWEGAYGHPRQQMQMQVQAQYPQQQHHHRHFGSKPKTYYENGLETNEFVFGALQEHDGRREAMVIKAVDYADPRYARHSNIRPRMNYVGYQDDY